MRLSLVPVAAVALIATVAAASAGPLGSAFPLGGRPGNPCPLGYSPGSSGRCITNSFGFGDDAFPLGYSVEPFSTFAPLYGRPYSIYATDGVSQYVIGR